jgi:hypothetical protein
MTRKYIKKPKYDIDIEPTGTHKDWRQGVYKKVVYKTNPNWKFVRGEVLLRDGFRCIRCEDGKKRKSLTAHHLIPRNEGGEDYLENLVTLCPACHDYVEIYHLRTAMDIIASFDLPLPETDIPTLPEKKPEKPDWRAYVYGGLRHG